MSDHNRFATLLDVLQYRAEQSPHQIGLIFLRDGERDEVSLTYGELDRRARTLARQLQEYAPPGVRALLLLPSSLDSIVSFLACLYAGVVAVPCAPPALGRPLSAQRAFAGDAQATVALTTGQVLSTMQEQINQDSILSKLRWLAVDRLTDHFDPADWNGPAVHSDTLALLGYTSGSTTMPRGIQLNHANLLSHGQGARSWYNTDHNDVSLTWSPLYHGSVLVTATLHALDLGIPFVLMPPERFLERPARWLQAISRYRATISGGPTFCFQLCLERVTPAECEGLDLSRWQMALCGGEPIRADVLEGFIARYTPYGFRKEALCASYGLSETSSLVTGGIRNGGLVIQAFDRQALAQNRVIPVPPDHAAARVLGGVGRALAGETVLIVDPDSGTVCPPAQVGEVWVSAPWVAQGYWHRAEDTAQCFQARLADSGEGPFLRTGDLGFFYQGELFIAGRLKEMIILYGRNIYVQDIEQVAEQSHPALQPGSSAAFARPRDGDESALVLMHEVRPNYTQVNVEEVSAAVRRAVAAQLQLPVDTVALVKAGSLPRTAMGKVQRYRCREAFLAKLQEQSGNG